MTGTRPERSDAGKAAHPAAGAAAGAGTGERRRDRLRSWHSHKSAGGAAGDDPRGGRCVLC